jgi:aspartyl-tRNA(Asn)/glutamyl-tRNA(Gln) amidotransferase subunit A
MTAQPTLEVLAGELASGRMTSRALVEDCLIRIAQENGQGATAFVSVDAEGATAQAEAMDILRRAGAEPSRFAGIPIAIKDLFDVRGQVTAAGSAVLADAAPATDDAPAVARLRAAGFVLIGRANMTEFAFSGLGLNPHHGTPLSPWRRDEQHISGGSTSGGAVAVADGFAYGALGSDTGGSCRIPAAWCGLAGFKPTASRVSRDGAVPLSTTLDSIGSIGRSIGCVGSLDAILSGEADELGDIDLKGLRFAAPTNFVLIGLDDAVAGSFERSLERLEQAGAVIDRVAFEVFDSIPTINAKGGFAASESWAWHRALIAAKGDGYDPRVVGRIRRGAEQEAADYIDLLAARASLIAAVEAQMAPYAAMLMPTTPIVPPRLADLADDAEYGRINLLALRNPTVINMFDGCAASIPMHAEGEPPAGLMIAGLAGADRRCLAIAAAIEGLLAS